MSAAIGWPSNESYAFGLQWSTKFRNLPREDAPQHRGVRGTGRHVPKDNDGPARPARISLNIFVVDDDPIALEALKYLLEAEGHVAHTYGSAATAAPHLWRKRPDVVIVDLVMAEIDGLELCRYVSTHPTLENTTLIAVSGLDEEYWRDRTSEVGAAGFLSKSVTASMVKEIEALAGVPRLS